MKGVTRRMMRYLIADGIDGGPEWRRCANRWSTDRLGDHDHRLLIAAGEDRRRERISVVGARQRWMWVHVAANDHSTSRRRKVAPRRRGGGDGPAGIEASAVRPKLLVALPGWCSRDAPFFWADLVQIGSLVVRTCRTRRLISTCASFGPAMTVGCSVGARR